MNKPLLVALLALTGLASCAARTPAPGPTAPEQAAPETPAAAPPTESALVPLSSIAWETLAGDTLTDEALIELLGLTSDPWIEEPGPPLEAVQEMTEEEFEAVSYDITWLDPDRHDASLRSDEDRLVEELAQAEVWDLEDEDRETPPDPAGQVAALAAEHPIEVLRDKAQNPPHSGERDLWLGALYLSDPVEGRQTILDALAPPSVEEETPHVAGTASPATRQRSTVLSWGGVVAALRFLPPEEMDDELLGAVLCSMETAPGAWFVPAMLAHSLREMGRVDILRETERVLEPDRARQLAHLFWQYHRDTADLRASAEAAGVVLRPTDPPLDRSLETSMFPPMEDFERHHGFVGDPPVAWAVPPHRFQMVYGEVEEAMDTLDDLHVGQYHEDGRPVLVVESDGRRYRLHTRALEDEIDVASFAAIVNHVLEERGEGRRMRFVRTPSGKTRLLYGDPEALPAFWTAHGLEGLFFDLTARGEPDAIHNCP